ncbi:hypothetical protein WJX82_011464 [Trebouxia sp. C0006]
MRRHPSPSHRQSKAKASVVAASLILALLLVIAVAARFSGSQGRVTYPPESEFGESYRQTAVLSEQSHSILPLGSAYVAVQLLREELQCDLPIEIWHIAGEIDAHTKAVFETSFSGVTCRDATTSPYPSHHKPANIRGYALKAFALYATSFTEVILLDADNLPVLNPALLFDSPEYQLHGNMFWPDLFALPLSRVSGIQAQAYHLLGWTEPWSPSGVGNSSFMFAESGQFLVNRRRHADVVEWAWFINSYGDDGVYQQLMNGDKDSFLLAFALANKITEYYQVPEYVRLCLHDVAEGSKLEHPKREDEVVVWALAGRNSGLHRRASLRTQVARPSFTRPRCFQTAVTACIERVGRDLRGFGARRSNDHTTINRILLLTRRQQHI